MDEGNEEETVGARLAVPLPQSAGIRRAATEGRPYADYYAFTVTNSDAPRRLMSRSADSSFLRLNATFS